jgi:hypothetical protein
MNTAREIIHALILLFTGETATVVDNSYVDTGEIIYNSGFSALKNATIAPTTDYYAAIENKHSFFAHTLKELHGKFGPQVN